MFVGPVCNPIVEARLESGFSVTTLAKRLGVSKQYISRAEHGTYSSLNNSLVTYGASKLQIKPGVFVQRYREFQKATRAATVDDVNPIVLARKGSYAPGNEIFSNWRADYWNSITAFCNAFCVHPEIVRAYEDGIREEMPAMIHHILTEYKIIDPNWIDDPKSIKKMENLNEARRNLDAAYQNGLVPQSEILKSANWQKL